MEGTILWDIREWVAEFTQACDLGRMENAYPGTCADIVGIALKTSLSDNCSMLSDCLYGYFGNRFDEVDPNGEEDTHNSLLTWLVDRTVDWMAEMHQVVSQIACEFDDYNIDDISLLSNNHVKVSIVGVYHDWVMNEHPVEPMLHANRKW